MKQIPTAETADECTALLRANLGQNMIEVLVPKALVLPNEASLVFFSGADRIIAEDILRKLGVDWEVSVSEAYRYTRTANHVDRVERFLEHAQADPNWKGNGLDFDAL
jgi:hypothetical protein